MGNCCAANKEEIKNEQQLFEKNEQENYDPHFKVRAGMEKIAVQANEEVISPRTKVDIESIKSDSDKKKIKQNEQKVRNF